MDIFGPQLQGYQTENPLKSMADVQTLYGNQQIQQKNALMLQQQQQEMQQTNALMQAVRQPGVINQETGEITSHGRNALMGVAPMVAPKLIQTMDLARQERTKSQVNELQAGMERLRINKMGAEALADAYTGMDEAYKAAVPTMGEQGARNYVNEQIRPDFEKKLKTGGLLPPEVTDKIGGTFDPVKNKVALAAAMRHAEMLKQQQAAEGGTLMLGDNVLPSGEVKQTLVRIPKSGPPLQYYPAEKKWVQADNLPPNLRGVNQLTTEQSVQKAGDIAEAQARGRQAAASPPIGDQSGLTGKSFIESISDPGDKATVQQIVQGLVPLESVSNRAMAGGKSRRDLVRDAVLQADPGFTSNRYPMYQAFTKGPQGQNITSLNTVIAHLGTAKDAADALGNGNVQVANSLFNRVLTEFGQPQQPTLDLARIAVGTELMRAFRGAGAGSEKEIERWESQWNAAKSQVQFNDLFKTAANLLGGRADQLNETWKSGTNLQTDFPNIVRPQSRAVLQKIGAKKEFINLGTTESGKTSTSGGTQERTIVQRGTEKGTGRGVVKYSDGTIEYAD